jgi:hypothetical protein
MDPMSKPTWNATVRQILDDQYALMVRKHADYGPGNIAAFGELGVLVRLSDKFERLKHLLLTSDATGRIQLRETAPANESIDIAIGICSTMRSLRSWYVRARGIGRLYPNPIPQPQKPPKLRSNTFPKHLIVLKLR